MKQIELDDLFKKMSLEEKVMQLVQIPGSEYETSAEITGIDRGDISDDIKKLAGSTLGIWGAKSLAGIQKRYMDKHPHRIPLMFMLDVIHGHKTVFPCPLGQGAMFDPNLIKEAATIQAKEAAADGVHVTFSPMTDLCRDARWGRVMESTGEDKYLNGLTSSAMIRGYEGDSLLNKEHIASCVKHFAAYGGAEAGRDYNNVELSEHTLREFYLKAYGEAVREKPAMVMTSFNTWNGIPATGSEFLMKKILREEMGFTGVLISDWGAIGEMVAHGYAEDLRDAAVKAMRAGVDIDMCSGAYSGYLKGLVEDGTIPEQMVDEAVMRVLKLKNSLGLFEDPFRGSFSSEEVPGILSGMVSDKNGISVTDMSRGLARKCVAKSLVLLENRENILPLCKEKTSGKKIALIGPYADTKKMQSSWAFSGADENTITLWEALQEAFEGTDTRITCSEGCLMFDQDTVTARGMVHDEDWASKCESMQEEALEIAEEADIIILCLGEASSQSGEATSRTEIELPAVQMELLQELRFTGKELITLVFTGRPLELSDVSDLTDALMVCWLPGTEGGHGIMDVLTGKENASGKLTMSFPYTVGQEPLHYDQYPTGRPKPQDGTGEFTSRYLDCPNDALYPFGYGLSYTEFEYSRPELDRDTLIIKRECDIAGNSRDSQEQTGDSSSSTEGDSINKENKIIATVNITNCGDLAGSTTAQLYIRDITGSRVRPVRELKGFRQVKLEPGESVDVSFEITEEMLRFWTADNKWASEPGRFTLWIGQDSTEQKGVGFTLDFTE